MVLKLMQLEGHFKNKNTKQPGDTIVDLSQGFARGPCKWGGAQPQAYTLPW